MCDKQSIMLGHSNQENAYIEHVYCFFVSKLLQCTHNITTTSRRSAAKLQDPFKFNKTKINYQDVNVKQ